jgi:hypothetical protein
MAHNKNEGEYCPWQAVKAVVVHGKMKKKKSLLEPNFPNDIRQTQTYVASNWVPSAG